MWQEKQRPSSVVGRDSFAKPLADPRELIGEAVARWLRR